MNEAQAEVTIERPAAVVWARVGDFSDISWFPGLDRWWMEGDERVAEITGMNLEHLERLVSRDDDTFTLVYETTGYRGDHVVTLPSGEEYDLNSMVGHHRGTIAVVPEGPSTSRLLYGFTAADGEDTAGQQQRYQQVIEGVKRELEASA
jgi:hypothetical protein